MLGQVGKTLSLLNFVLDSLIYRVFFYYYFLCDNGVISLLKLQFENTCRSAGRREGGLWLLLEHKKKKTGTQQANKEAFSNTNLPNPLPICPNHYFNQLNLGPWDLDTVRCLTFWPKDSFAVVSEGELRLNIPFFKALSKTFGKHFTAIVNTLNFICWDN